MEMARRESGASSKSACGQEGRTRSSEESRLKVVNIKEIVVKYAQQNLNEYEKKSVDVDHPEIDWSRMYTKQDEAMYVKKDSTSQSQPTAHVLFTANFSNDTPTTQRYKLTTERRTKSTCNISLVKTFTIGASVDIKLTPPSPVVEANAGFSRELSVEKGVSQTFERELTWTVDNVIEVPPGYVTTAELEIKEDEFDAEFTTRTTFEGRLTVSFITKKEERITFHQNIKDILEDVDGFTTEGDKAYFVTSGQCKCKFGIEQHVLLKQSPLPQAVEQ